MKLSTILLICTFAIFAYLIVPCLTSHHSFSKSQSIDAKEQYLHKKNGYSKDKKHNLYENYQFLDEDWSNEDMQQHPIDESPRKGGRSLGEMCSYSSDCSSGCCLLDRETKIRSCQNKAVRGEKCTSAQVKGDLYVDACPCLRGDDACAYPGEFCTS